MSALWAVGAAVVVVGGALAGGWLGAVMYQVDEIRAGRMRTDDESVIGATRWWIKRRSA